MGKKKSAVKKKRISKHMLKSSKEQASNATENNAAVAEAAAPETVTPSSSKSRKKRDAHVKDPEEAASYLSAWKASQTQHNNNNKPLDNWKFNKNTQSWLIRHMYEVDKVSKGTFSLLLEYLHGLQGNKTKSRIISEATRRARRYKEHVSRQENNNKDGGGESGDDDDKRDTSKLENAEPTTEQPTDMSKEDLEDEEARWKKLDDHDKRKEYKRARKVLDVIRTE